MDNEQEFLCATCGEPITSGEMYASIGGNLDPYIPAKMYHIRCIPTAKSLLLAANGVFTSTHASRAVGTDDFDFQKCEACVTADPRPATFIAKYDGVNHYFCEEHGVSQNLSRGIPMNPAEHENKCSGCQAPLEDGTVCSDCAVHATLQKSAEFTKKFLESPEGIAALKAAGLRLNLDAFDKMLEDFLLPLYTPPETFGRAAVPNQIGPKRFSGDWFRAHVDHFIISFMVGVPLLIANAIASNVFTHHAAQILQAFHIPETILHGLGY